MGTKDHDEALAAARKRYDEAVLRIAEDPGLDQKKKAAVFAAADAVTDGITDAVEKAERGFQTVTLIESLVRNPGAILDKVKGILPF